jgi:hypothetical protein
LGLVAASKAAVAQSLLPALPTFFYPSLLLIVAVTVIMFLYLHKVADRDRYVQLFLLLTVVKLVACLAYCTVMVLKRRPDLKTDVVFFIGIYIVFTAAEVFFLYKNVSQKRD